MQQPRHPNGNRARPPRPSGQGQRPHERRQGKRQPSAARPSDSRVRRAAKPSRRAAPVRHRRTGCLRPLALLVLLLLVPFLLFRCFSGGKQTIEPTEQVFATVPVDVTQPSTAPTQTLSPLPTAPTAPPATTAPVQPSTTPTNTLPSGITYAKRTAKTASLDSSFYCPNQVLIDVSSNTIVAARDADARIYPASLTKVMTLITAHEMVKDPYNERFTMTYDILHPLIESGNSLAGFEERESAPLIDYYYGMIMASGADAAEGIAVYCSGSVDAFVDAMNRKAKAMGIKNSHFTNPVGTHDSEHYSTVHDMALILGYAYQDPLLAKVLSTYQYTTASTDIHPGGLYFESSLQQRMHGDESGTCTVLGGKTGYTTEAANCVVCYARSDKTGKAYLFAAAKGKQLYHPIWDCIKILKDYVS